MELENPIDFGGKEIHPRDIVTDDLLGEINSLNPLLGTEADPHYEEYRQFRDEIQNADIITLDVGVFSRHSLDSINLDLSGNNGNIENCGNIFITIGNTVEALFKGIFGVEDLEKKNSCEGFEDYLEFSDESFGVEDIYETFSIVGENE